MTHTTSRPLLALAGLLAAGAAATVVAAGLGSPDGAGLDPPRRAAAAAPAPVRVGAAPVLGRSVPDRLEIAAIGVEAPLMTLGLRTDGTVDVPPLDATEAGWYEHSPTPGERGPAVLLGHVGSAHRGHGVFHDLGALRPGDVVRVHRADGSTALFAVDGVARYPKSDFPTRAVYGDLDRPGLRLVTCGGVFDTTAGSYTDNVVVYATAAV